VDKIELGLLIEYCDSCAEENTYPVKKEKPKGVCKLCGRIGRVNQISQVSIVDCRDFNYDAWKGGGFTIDQLIPFPIGQLRETIHPTLSSRILTEKCALYFDKNLVIIANPKTGQQIRIRF
jgi:hypothetical protein